MNMRLETGSPRISYSLDIGHMDVIPVEQLAISPPSPVFEFGTSGNFEFEQSSADELFENGVILPSHTRRASASRSEEEEEEQEEVIPPPPQPLPLLSPLHLRPPSLGDEDYKFTVITNPNPEERPVHGKSLWGVRRSSSVGSESSKRLSFLFPIPILPRSGSVSSAPNPKQRPPRMAKSYSSGPADHNSGPLLLRKCRSGGSSSGSYKVAPVLNVPSCCASRGAASTFGFGCLSLWGKEKKSRERG